MEKGKGTGKQGERGHIRMITKSRDIFHLATLFDALWRKAATIFYKGTLFVYNRYFEMPFSHHLECRIAVSHCTL